jgi:pilus assembly protein CpaB
VKTLLQNIQVLSAGKNFQHDTDGKPIEVQVVNLLVTPEQAELLSLANNETKIQLVLRNPIDHQMATPPGTELASVFGGPEAPVVPVKPVPAPKPIRVAVTKIEEPKPVPPPPYIVEVINGAKQTEQKFVIEGEAW